MDQAFEDWVERGRKAPVWDAMCQLNGAHGLKLRSHKAVGPCPGCGGTDRFAIDVRRNSWFCRKLYSGGNAIDLAIHVLGCEFLRACEEVVGEPPPKGPGGKPVDPAVVAAREARRREEDAARAKDHAQWRDKEINRAHVIWKEGREIAGTAAEAYLALRGVEPSPGSRLRFHGNLAYWHQAKGWDKPRVIHQGPAMLARMDDADHHFKGVHCTYLDLSRAKGKADIFCQVTGEQLPAKKMRGSKKGHHIHLGGPADKALRLYIGEGIETVLAVRQALLAAGRDISNSLFWTSCDLGNLGGPHLATVEHPSLTFKDARGRERKVRVAGPVPAWPHHENILMPPSQIEEVVLLGDGDSEAFATECHLRRAAARWSSETRIVKRAMAADGTDFGDMWSRVQQQAAGQGAA